MPSLTSDIPFRTWLALPELVEGDWTAATTSDSLIAHLNFRGEGELHWVGGGLVAIPPRTVCWLRAAPEELRIARRLASRERHECLTLVFPNAWLGRTLQGFDTEVGAAFQALVAGSSRSVLRLPMTEEDEGWARGAMPPHLCDQARQLLDSARLTDFLIRSIFRRQTVVTPGDGAISRTQRASQERVSRVKERMLAQLETPPSLDELAAEVGCNPSHLSRTFTQVEGCTLSRWLRRARIDHAATLIASGRCNVSEAALEVGYQSFSHFSRAFAEEKGVPPSQWVRRLGGVR